MPRSPKIDYKTMLLEHITLNIRLIDLWEKALRRQKVTQG